MRSDRVCRTFCPHRYNIKFNYTSCRRSRTRSCPSAFEREQKRAGPRTDEHGWLDRPARTNGRRFVCQKCMTDESRFAYLDVTFSRRTLMHAEESCNCESCYDNVRLLLLEWLASALCYLLNWLARSSSRCRSIDTCDCVIFVDLVVFWSRNVYSATYLQRLHCEFEKTFPVLNIYLFLQASSFIIVHCERWKLKLMTYVQIKCVLVRSSQFFSDCVPTSPRDFYQKKKRSFTSSFSLLSSVY
jgi:hypothetical protein